MAARLVGQFLRFHEQGRRSILVDDGRCQRQGGPGNIAAADIEQPGDRGRSRDDGRVRCAALDRDTNALTLGCMILARILQRLGIDLCHGRCRTVRPGRVDRIDLDADKLDARAVSTHLETLEGGRAVQACVIADFFTGSGLALDPSGEAFLHEIPIVENVAVGLLADLQGVATIHKDRCTVFHDNGGARGTGETGNPQKTFIAVGQILVVILVLVRDEEAIKAELLQLCAEFRDVVATELRAALHVESLGNHLGHERTLGPLRDGFNRCATAPCESALQTCQTGAPVPHQKGALGRALNGETDVFDG